MDPRREPNSAIEIENRGTGQKENGVASLDVLELGILGDRQGESAYK